MKHEVDPTTLNVSLPRAQREFVEAAAARLGCTTTSEYVRRLIHDAQQRQVQEELESRVLEGLRSGKPIDVTPKFWEERRRNLLRRHKQQKKS
jgi:antitoxin ParD1/3/4